MSGTVVTTLIIMLILVGAVIVTYFFNEQNKINAFKASEKKLPPFFTVTAHTGCENTKDNSIESIEEGIKNGADIVEFDLNFTSDATPVLAHDEAKGDEVTLQEAFSFIAKYEKIKINVDVKTVSHLEKVKLLAQKYGLTERIFFTGIKDEFVSAAKETGIEYYLNVSAEKPSKHSEEYLLFLVEKVKNSGAVGINLNKNGVSENLVKAFRENGFKVSVWTVDNEKDIVKILSMSPDNITTRYPKKVKSMT